MKYIRPRFAALVLLPALVALAGVAALGPSALAADCGGIQTAVVDCAGAKDTTGSPVVAILVMAIQILTGAVGVVAIGALVYAGILYSSASSDAGQVTKAKDIIRNTIIGLILFALMATVLNFLIPGGLFSGSAKFGAGGNGLGNIKASPIQERTKLNNNDSSPSARNSSGAQFGGITKACYEVGYKGKAWRGNVYHRSGKQSYAFENSPEGVKYAAAHNYERIDIDLRETKDGVIVATHSIDPLNKRVTWGGFKDTAGKIKNRKTKVTNMTWAQVQRLRHVDGYRIHMVEDIIKAAAAEKIGIDFEIKQPKDSKEDLPYIAALANKYKVQVTIKTQSDYPGARALLPYARRLGFATRDISRNNWDSPNKDASLCSKFRS